ncbi:MAG TPA: PVC-type heme-binding CxxCH protein [Pirellulales bacterium]|nr:PVC-type heme-binding CxxCH protein [Pirellulales bacterium]
MRKLRQIVAIIAALGTWNVGQHANAQAADSRASAVERIASPLEPEEALRHFRLAPGLAIELVAAEPEVIDPVAARFDEEGKLWVVEMRDYPNGPERGAPPLSRVKCLEDADGDGRFETARLFADQLLFATGVQPWHGGVIVTYSGRVEWLKDTDGDGRADVRETWFTGFAEENPQLRANHPLFAIDNYVYVANGLRGGMIASTWRRDHREISISGRDFRFEPLHGAAEAVSGNGQFGLTFDDFGNRFICNNRNPLMHVVLEDRYLARNPMLAVPGVVNDVAAAGDASHIYPLSQAWTTSILHAGQFTAACGAHIYRGDALPERFYGDGLTCEPTGSLVHCESLSPAGASFAGRPEREGVEFLASPDGWFRPVNLTTGPDGALYVVDMYRAVIEHPQFVPDELKNRPDLRDGDDRGRIYRIVKADWRRPPRPKLPLTDPTALAKLLAHPNAWWRETAARLLYERQNRQVAPTLATMVQQAPDPRTRVQALWLLSGMRELDADLLQQAMNDPAARVREAAVLLSERLLDETPALRHRVIELAGDPDARLRFQVALSLGFAPGDDVIAPLARIALRGADDVWTRRAVLTSVGTRPGKLMIAMIEGLKKTKPSDGTWHLLDDTARLVGARHEAAEVSDVLKALSVLKPSESSDAMRLTVLSGVARGVRGRGMTWQAMTDRLSDSAARDAAREIFSQAAETARRNQASAEARQRACAALAYASDELALGVLPEIIQAAAEQPLRLAAIAALAAHDTPRVAELLLADLPQQTPVARHAVIDALLARPDRAGRLLGELAAGRLKPAELDPAQAQRLLRHSDPRLRARAGQLLAAALPADRAKVVAQYQSSLELKADPEHGREIFKKNCATCHRIGDLGVDVAPSIADSRTKTQQQLLTDILEPSRAIDNNYVSYSATTNDGQSFVGIVAAETASSITLKLPEGKTVSLLRGDIDELRSNGVSLMPEGLEKNISVQEMADLISFIKNWRYLDARLPARAGK